MKHKGLFRTVVGVYVAAQITCIRKSALLNAEDRILKIGGVLSSGRPFSISQQQAVYEIEREKKEFYIQRGRIHLRIVVAVGSTDRKYLKTTADGVQPQSLLALPECS